MEPRSVPPAFTTRSWKMPRFKDSLFQERSGNWNFISRKDVNSGIKLKYSPSSITALCLLFVPYKYLLLPSVFKAYHLAGFRSKTECLQDGVFANALQTCNTRQRPSLHSSVHFTAPTFNFLDYGPVLSIWFEVLKYGLVAEQPTQRVQFGPCWTHACIHVQHEAAIRCGCWSRKHEKCNL